VQSSLEPVPTEDALRANPHFICRRLIGPYSSYSAYPVCEVEGPAYFLWQLNHVRFAKKKEGILKRSAHIFQIYTSNHFDA
jgi:hypothetical protein